MKKMVLTLAIVAMFFIAGVPSVVSLNSRDEIKTTDITNIQSVAGYKDFISKQGIKIWARGYGNLETYFIDNDIYKYELVFGDDINGDQWKVNVYLREDITWKEFNIKAANPSFSYQFVDDEDLDTDTRVDALAFPSLTLPLMMYIFAPKLLDKFRLNHKTPIIEAVGGHQCEARIFLGSITKGMDFYGNKIPSIGDNCYYEVRGRCGAYSMETYEVHIHPLKLLWEELKLQKIPDNEFITWIDPYTG